MSILTCEVDHLGFLIHTKNDNFVKGHPILIDKQFEFKQVVVSDRIYFPASWIPNQQIKAYNLFRVM